MDPTAVEISLIFLLKQISISIFDKYCKIQTNLSLMSGVFILHSYIHGSSVGILLPLQMTRLVFKYSCIVHEKHII